VPSVTVKCNEMRSARTPHVASICRSITDTCWLVGDLFKLVLDRRECKNIWIPLRHYIYVLTLAYLLTFMYFTHVSPNVNTSLTVQVIHFSRISRGALHQMTGAASRTKWRWQITVVCPQRSRPAAYWHRFYPSFVSTGHCRSAVKRVSMTCDKQKKNKKRRNKNSRNINIFGLMT
jgi:hypothetical protein